MTARIDLDEVERLLADATPTPWRVEWLPATNPDDEPVRHEAPTNRDLVIASVNALPALLAAVRAAEKVAIATDNTERWSRIYDLVDSLAVFKEGKQA